MPLPSGSILRSQASLLAVLDRVLDTDYLTAKKATPRSGYELLQALALAAARVSTAIERAERGGLILWAGDGAQASVQVRFKRTTTTAGALIVRIGTVVSTSIGGREFVTVEDAVFGGGTTDVKVRAVAVAEGYQWNVPSFEDGLPGSIDTIVRMVQTDPTRAAVTTLIDTTLTVEQPEDALGGVDGYLNGLGDDRGMPRQDGEAVDHYRNRIRTLPDVVTPAAIRRQVATIVEPYGVSGAVVELWAPTAHGRFGAGLHYGDPRPGFGARLLSATTVYGAFVVNIPDLPCIAMHGMHYGDPAANVGELKRTVGTVVGRRAASVYGLTAAAPVVASGDCLLGYLGGPDTAKAAVYAAVQETLDRVKAGGVVAQIAIGA